MTKYTIFFSVEEALEEVSKVNFYVGNCFLKDEKTNQF